LSWSDGRSASFPEPFADLSGLGGDGANMRDVVFFG